MSTAELRRELIDGVRKCGGRATLGDLMGATTRSGDEIQNAIIPALNAVGGHVAVDENGELVYSVLNPRPLPDERSLWQRLGSFVLKVLSISFITALSVTLVAYFVFYVVLLICLAVLAVVAASQGGDCDCSCDGCDCVNCSGCGDTCGDCCVIGSAEKKAAKREARQEKREQHREKRTARKERRLISATERREQRRVAMERARQRFGLRGAARYLGFSLEQEHVTQKPRFYRAVYDFIFGPPRAKADARERERNIVAYIRCHAGRISAADAVSLTGRDLPSAERILLDITARYEGDIEVSDDGALIYRFDRLITSAADDVKQLKWIAAQGGTTAVSDFARRFEMSAADALSRLHLLAGNYFGEISNNSYGLRFSFPHSASSHHNLTQPKASGEAPAPREYSFCWERLERSPAILGIPIGERGWIYAFNILNLLLSLALSVYFTAGDAIVEVGFGEAWIFGYQPLLFSVLVFAIPAARWIIRGIRNGERAARNAWRVFLLSLFSELETTSHVMPSALVQKLYGRDVPQLAQPMVSMLERALKDLDGSIDTESGIGKAGAYTYTFERLHIELQAVEHDRLSVDLKALSVTTIIYDSASPEI